MRTLTLAIAVLALASPQPRIERPFFTSELLFSLEHWHNHASMVVDLPSGELFAC